MSIKMCFLSLFLFGSIQTQAQTAYKTLSFNDVIDICPLLKPDLTMNRNISQDSLRYYSTKNSLEGIQVCVKNQKLITIRWYSIYNIRTCYQLQDRTITKILKLYNQQECVDWFLNVLKRIDREPFRDHYSSHDFNHRITIQFSSKTRALEVMLKQSNDQE